MDEREAVITGAFTRHSEVLEKSLKELLPDVRRAAELLIKAFKAGHKLLACGNGGSAADAQHFAAEFVCKYAKDRKPLPAIALTVDTSAITAIGNDYGFEHIFSRQIKALGRKGDVLVALSTSGTSKNILNAIHEAKELGLQVVLLTGSRGKGTQGADVVIAVPSEETARIQEVHELIYHAWCEYVDSVMI